MVLDLEDENIPGKKMAGIPQGNRRNTPASGHKYLGKAAFIHGSLKIQEQLYGMSII